MANAAHHKKRFFGTILGIFVLIVLIIGLQIGEQHLRQYVVDLFVNKENAASLFTAVLNILRLVLWMALIIGIVRLFNSLVFGVWRERKSEIPTLFQNIVSIAIYIIAFFVIFKTIYPAFDLAALFTTSAIFGVILGLALQDTLGNLFAGIAIQADQPFEVGDVISIPNKGTGVVESATWRGVKIRTFQNRLIVISNSVLGKESIEVAPRDNLNARLVSFSTTYDESPANTIQTIREAVREIENVSPQRRPVVRIRNLGESGLEWEVKYWIEDYSKFNETDALIRQRIWYACQRASIKFAFPIRSVISETRPLEAENFSSADAIFERLSQVELFAPLSEDEMRRLLENADRRVFAPNEIIVRAGEIGKSMFIVHRGSVRVIVPGTETSVITPLDEGKIFGEMGLFTNEPRTANVIAIEETEVVEISYDAMKKLLEANPDLSKNISQIITERRVKLNAEIVNARQKAVETESSGVLRSIKKLFGLH